MKSVAIRVHTADAAADVVLSLHGDATVSEVFEALQVPSTTAIDGWVPDAPQSTRAHKVLHCGSALSVTPVCRPDRTAAGLVDASVVAGLNASGMRRLTTGVFHLSMTSGDAQAAWFVHVPNDSRSQDVAAPWQRHGSTVEVVGHCRGSTLAIGSPIDPEPTPPDDGLVNALRRPPRPQPPDGSRPIEFERVPEPVREPMPLSWATLLGPIPIAVLMALFFRPIFALFAAMGPAIALGRWWESRRRYRRSSAQRDAAIVLARQRTSGQIVAQAEAEARRLWHERPHVAALRERARVGSVRLWQRRPTDPDFMVASIGIGPMSVAAAVPPEPPPQEVADLIDGPMMLRAVPHVVDLSSETAIGIHGLREHALAVAYALIAQIATTHGPADVRIGVLCAREQETDWDWLKWLPHVDHSLVGHDAGTLAVQRASTPRLAAQPHDQVGPIRLVIVDSPDAPDSALLRRAAASDSSIRYIAVGVDATALPAICSTVVGVTQHDLALNDHDPKRSLSDVAPIGLSLHTADAWARSLSRFSDPEATNISPQGDQRLSFSDLIGHVDAEGLGEHWAMRAATAPPTVVLGHGPGGPFSLDLTVDGPHALIAGTTGSGKSELLRTFVAALAAECAPDQLNFVLVDFKGGGAFDVVRSLPHVVGMITDLDESLVVRALVSIRAELERRERLFRELRVSTFAAAAAASTASLARLVIVIDEFAVLATDYGELLDGIVDLAARGRSLGMHLVLATQRPSGVVDQKIRANANIRIALRVQDTFDSQDIIGCADAAEIDRRAPGSAIVCIGGDAVIPVRFAFGGHPMTEEQQCIVRSHRLFGADADSAGCSDAGASARLDAHASPQDRVAQTELEALVESIASAGRSQNFDVRPLWAPLLPTRLDWIDLRASDIDEPDLAGFALGLVDVPERQTQLPWRWDPGSGALAVYGASGESAAKVLVALAAALAAAPRVAHLYVIDGGAGAVCALEDVPYVGSCIRAHETERVERTLRAFETAIEARRLSLQTTDPALVLVIDNLASTLSAHDEAVAAQLQDRLAALARDGAALRVHLVIAARTPRDITHRLAQQIPNRLVMDLADANGFLSLGMRLRDVVPLPPMRAIDVRTRHVVQLVEPPDIADLVSCDPAAHWVAPAIAPFPTRVDAQTLPSATVDGDRALSIPIGIDSSNLGVTALWLRPGEHALIVAAPGMGGTTALELLALQLEHLDHVDVVAICPATSGATVHALRIANDITVVLVDDGESLPPALAAALGELIDAKNPNVRVVASVRPDCARSIRSWVAQIRSSANGLLIGGTASDGDIFRVRLRSLDGRGTLPGRANLVDRGRVTDVQLAQPNAGGS